MCICRAYKAQQSGWFDDEIIPVQTKIHDTDGSERAVTVCTVKLVQVGVVVSTVASHH